MEKPEQDGTTFPSGVERRKTGKRKTMGLRRRSVEDIQREEHIDALVKQHQRDRQADDSDSEADDEDKELHFVDWTSFNVVIGVVIMLNALTIGLEANVRVEADGDDISTVWYIFEVIFCLLFIFELASRLYFHGLRYFTDQPHEVRMLLRSGSYRDAVDAFFQGLQASNTFDMVVVVMSVIDTFILQVLDLGGVLRFTTFMRFVRIMRLIRLVRLLKLTKELWMVTSSLGHAMKILAWVFVVMAMLLYISGMLVTAEIGINNELYNDYYTKVVYGTTRKGWDHELYFKTIFRSMFTLFQMMTLESWTDDIARHVVRNQPGMLIFLILFLGVLTFGLMNIVIAIVVENTLAQAERDEKRLTKAKERDRLKVFSQLRDIFVEADADQSGSLDVQEVIDVIARPEIYNKLKMIDFPVENPVQIFTLLDYDDSGELSIDEFISGCLRMKGSAKSKDLLVAQVAVDQMKRSFDAFEEEMKTCHEKIEDLQRTTVRLIEQGELVFLNTREYRRRHPDYKSLAPPPVSHDHLKSASSTNRRLSSLTRTDRGSPTPKHAVAGLPGMVV